MSDDPSPYETHSPEFIKRWAEENGPRLVLDENASLRQQLATLRDQLATVTLERDALCAALKQCDAFHKDVLKKVAAIDAALQEKPC